MATTNEAVLAELKQINRTMKGGSSLRMGGSSMDDATGKAIMAQKRQTEAYGDSTKGILSNMSAMKKLSKNVESFADMTGLAEQQMKDMVENMDAGELKNAAQTFRKNLKASGSEWVRNIAAQVNTGEDFIEMQKLMTEGMVEEFEAAQILYKGDAKAKIKAINILNKYGMEVDDLAKESKELKEELKEVAMAADATHRETVVLPASIKNLVKGAGAAATALATVALKATESAARTGTQMETLDALIMGMSPEELNQLQAQHRQTMLASNMTFDEFNEKVGQNRVEMIEFTGSLRDAVRMNAQAIEQAKLLGQESGKAMKQQQEQFKRFNRALSMSAEQFMELNSQLMDSTHVQSQLYRISFKQRAAYMEDLRNTYEKLRLDGLTHEQAQKMLETFEQIGAKSPRERMKEAAKLQAVMGAMGMGAAGAEAGQLLRGGLRGEGDKQRFAEIMKNANINIGEKMGEGFASEMMTMQMIQTAGMEQYLGPSSDFADFNKQQGAQVEKDFLEQQAQTNILNTSQNWLKDILKYIMMGYDLFKTFVGTGLGAALAGLAAWFVGGKFLAGFGTSITGALAKAAIGLPGVLSTAFTAAMPAMGVAVAGGVGLAVGAALDRGLEKFFPEFHKGMQEVVGGAIFHTIEGAESLLDKVGDWFSGNDSDESTRLQKEQLSETRTFRNVLAESAKRNEEFQKKQAELTAKTNTAITTQTDEQKKMAEEGQKNNSYLGRRSRLAVSNNSGMR